jgi:hypothetical protein
MIRPTFRSLLKKRAFLLPQPHSGVDLDYLILALGGYLVILGGLLIGLYLVGSLP